MKLHETDVSQSGRITSCRFFLLTAAALLSNVVFGEVYFTYRIFDDVRYWDSAAAWYNSSGTALNRLPASGGSASDCVWLTGTDLAYPTPLLVTNGVAAKCASIIIGREKNSVAALHVKSGASLTTTNGGGANESYGRIIGSSGSGLLVNEGTVDFFANNGMFIGRNAGSCGIVSNLSGSVRANKLYAGYNANSTGIVVVAGGMFYDNSYSREGPIVIGHVGVGRLEVLPGGTCDGCYGDSAGKLRIYLGNASGGDGTFLVKGGKVAKAYVHIGHATNSVGRMSVSGPVTNTEMRTVYVGVNGTGTFDVESFFEEGELRVGGTGIGTGTMTVYDGATNKLRNTWNKDSGNAYIGGGSNPDFGAGLLILKGGTIAMSYTGPSFNLGRGQAAGTIRGWGKVAHTAGSGTLSMYFGNGYAVGDGEGFGRTLDLNGIDSFSRATTNSVSGGTNGWYAVNRGCVHYPYTSYSKTASDVTRTLGDVSSGDLDLVNSVRVTISGSGKAAGVVHGGVYAKDRTDCHLDELPSNDGLVGVWKLGVAAEGKAWRSWEEGTPRTDWATVAVQMRYDESAIPEDAASLRLYRYQDGAWTRVARKRLADGGSPIIEAENLARIADNAANIGTFALVANNQRGMVMIFR